MQRTTLCGLVGSSGGLVVVGAGGREMAMGTSVVGVSRWKSVQCSSSIGSSRGGGGGERRWRAVKEEVQVMQNEETQNGASILPPAYPTFGGRSSPSNEYIGFGMLEEKDAFYRERFVVRFSEVGDRGTTSLEMLASLLQVLFYRQIVEQLYNMVVHTSHIVCGWTFNLISKNWKDFGDLHVTWMARVAYGQAYIVSGCFVSYRLHSFFPFPSLLELPVKSHML